MLIILFTMLTIIEVAFKLLGVIHTEYNENCFEIVISSAITPRNKSPPTTTTITFQYPSDS